MPNLTIDNGGLNIKVGFTSSQTPNLINQNKFIRMGSPNLFDSSVDYLYGDDADFLSGYYQVRHPIENGKIKDWDAMTKIWEDIFNKVGISSPKDTQIDHNEYRLYFVTSINYTANCYNKILDFVFSRFKVTHVGFGIDSINALYSSGNTTGLVVDSGDSLTKIMAVIEGFVDQRSIWQSDLAGREFTKTISKNVFNTYNEPVTLQKLVDHLKSNCFYHKRSREEQVEEIQSTIVLPDGNTITLGDEKWRFADNFFNPELNTFQNIAEGYQNSIAHLDRETQSRLISNTFITGGNTLTKNFDCRFLEECELLQKKSRIGIIENNNKLNASFKGSSLFFETNLFEGQLISKQEYEEAGKNILRKKNLLLLC